MKYTLRRPVEAIRFAEDGSNWREVCTFMGDTTDYDNDPI